jgi:beta-galactosidase
MVQWDDIEFDSGVFSDVLENDGNAAVLGSYKNNYYAGKPALVCNNFGRGKVYYFGGTFNRESALIFLKKLNVIDPYKAVLEAPECCEVAVRKGNGRHFIFVLNFSQGNCRVHLKEELLNICSGEKKSGEVELPPFGTLVLEE